MNEPSADRQLSPPEPRRLSPDEPEYFRHHDYQFREGNGGTPEAFFPVQNLPDALREKMTEDGLWLAVGQASWLGPPGDRERLESIYGPEVPYGEAAWREISDRLVKFYQNQGETDEVKVMLDQVRAVHDDFLGRVRTLPPHRQSYYHNVSDWAAGSGHADQVMIAAARELIGAISATDPSIKEFSLWQFGIVLKAMAVHDAGWSLVDSKQTMSHRALEFFVIPQPDLTEVFAVVAQVDYDTDSASRSMQETALELLKKNWGDDIAQMVHSIVRRSDLLQVADRNYSKNKRPLTTDFYLRRPDFTKTWDADDPEKEVTAKTPFYSFAKSKIYGEKADPWRYSQEFFGSGQPNPAATGWQIFEEQVKAADPAGWAALEAAS